MLHKLETTSFSSVLIGNESLLIGCAELLQERHCPIRAIVSDNPEIQNWAKDRFIPVHQLDQDLQSKLRGQSFDWLFSIANLKIIPDESFRSRSCSRRRRSKNAQP